MDYKFISEHIKNALTTLKLPTDIPFAVEVVRDDKFGDFSSNVCMVLAKKCGLKIEELAEKLTAELIKNKDFYEKIEYAKPGFINFFIAKQVYKQVIDYYNNPNFEFEKIPPEQRQNINVEYVSANPTGFLHLGHVRNGLVGDVVSRVLSACGHEVFTEYWINDLGNQIRLFVNSIFARYLQLYKIDVPFAEDGYQGREPLLIAKKLRDEYGKKFVDIGFDWEEGIHDLSTRTLVRSFALENMLAQAKHDLTLIGVKISTWTSEEKLYKTKVFDLIREKYLKDVIYEKDGALWIKTTLGGDEKDRVLIKSNGDTTYFVTDIANHYNKLQRGAQKMIDVWGADQTGQIMKLKFALNHFCDADKQFGVVLHQMVKLVKNGEEVRLSKRKGQVLTIPDLLKIFDADAVRWLILSQATNTPIVIDIKTDKKELNSAVYYVQYTYARACQLIKKVEDKIQVEPCNNFELLTDHRERAMIVQMLSFEKLLHKIANSLEIHQLCNFILNVSKIFNSWYDDCYVLNSDKELMIQRYWLINAFKNMTKNVLSLLGISAHKKMGSLTKEKK